MLRAYNQFIRFTAFVWIILPDYLSFRVPVASSPTDLLFSVGSILTYPLPFVWITYDLSRRLDFPSQPCYTLRNDTKQAAHANIHMPVTLRDIAAATGLSLSTVSNILSSNDPRYSAETRARVLRAAEKLDYHPHHAARALKGHGSRVIGVLVPDLSYSYFPDIIRGIESAADEAGCQVLLCQTHYREEDEARRISLLREHRVYGIIMFPIAYRRQSRDVFHRLRRSRIPLVCVDAPLPNFATDFVGTDDYHGALTAVRYLTHLGHRRIACVAFGDDSAVRQERLRGYRDALAQVKVSPSPSWLINAPWKLTAPGDDLVLTCSGTSSCTAIFAMSDLLAIWAYLALRSAGRIIPRDVSIVGFGGLHEGQWLDPPLTTMRQDLEGMGRAAVSLLLDRAAYPDRPCKRILLKPQLVVNASTQPLPHPSTS
ncbi:MAG: LacI family transcriptional regulator [bacterium]|nr:LacI family transcriptional regulator [bacterium]